MFAETIEKAKKTNFELELLKIVDCFLDGHGIYDTNLVSLKLKSLKRAKLLITVSKRNECSQRTQNAN